MTLLQIMVQIWPEFEWNLEFWLEGATKIFLQDHANVTIDLPVNNDK